VVFIGKSAGNYWSMEGWEDNDASGQKALRICRYDSTGRRENIPLTFKFIPEGATKRDSDAICARIKKACDKIDVPTLSLSGLKFFLPSREPFTADGVLLGMNDFSAGRTITWSISYRQEMCWYFYSLNAQMKED
jgi:hypothetical protein